MDEKKNKNKKVLIIILAIVLLLSAAFGVWMIARNKATEEPTVVVSTTADSGEWVEQYHYEEKESTSTQDGYEEHSLEAYTVN